MDSAASWLDPAEAALSRTFRSPMQDLPAMRSALEALAWMGAQAGELQRDTRKGSELKPAQVFHTSTVVCVKVAAQTLVPALKLTSVPVPGQVPAPKRCVSVTFEGNGSVTVLSLIHI